MKIFAIRSDSMRKAKDLAYLIYYENAKSFYIELPEDADEWETPLILSSYLKKGERTVDAYHSKMWVQQRIVPPDRQNLGQILKENGLDSYDEFELLMLSKGRCSQDDYYIQAISKERLPDNFEERFGKRVEDVVPLHNEQILTFFRNGQIKKCNVSSYIDSVHARSLLSQDEKFRTVEIQTDGYGVAWGTVLSISNEQLYAMGTEIELSLDDFKCFATNRIISIAEACEILDCSRQNVSDLISRGKLSPVALKGNQILLMKKEVLQRKWD